ncbi:pyocin knob domain-containing protein, partial [Lachnospiraceae bacterium 29-84]
MADFQIPGNPEYSEKIRKFEPEDEGHADLFNAVVQGLVNNDAALKKELAGKSSTGHTHAAASTAAAGFMSPTDKRKLNGIAENANNYTHPPTHPGSMVEQDTTHRFVSDAEKRAWDGVYEQSAGYTDQKIADLIGGDPETLGTLKEFAEAVKENGDLIAGLNDAIGKKASQAELDTHTGNSTIHVTATDKGNWDKAMGERTVTFTQATGRANIASGEKLSTILGKVRKFFADLKAVAFTGSYSDLEDKPGAKDIGAAQVGQVYYQDFRTILEPGLYWVYCGGGSNGRPDSSCDTYALVVVGDASRSITQIAASVPGGEVFINTKAGDSGWAGWRQVGAGLPRAADTSDAPRKLWFDSPDATVGEGKLAYDTDFTFNPANHNLKVANFNSNVISQARASYTRNTWYKVAFHGYSDVGWGSCIIDLKRVYNNNNNE